MEYSKTCHLDVWLKLLRANKLTICQQETIVLKIEIPKGCKLQQHIDEFEKQCTGDFKKDIDYVEKGTLAIFQDVSLFMNSRNYTFPTTRVLLIYDNEHYLEVEKNREHCSIVKEPSKNESFAFVVHNRYSGTMYLNMDRLLKLLVKHGFPTFTLNLISTYIHEFLHEAKPDFAEQAIHNLECLLVEDYLGIKLPDDFKNLKASDYYQEEK